MLEITLKPKLDEVRVYFNDILHLRFNRNKLIAIQSWFYLSIYIIELTMIDGVVVLEYDDKTKWKKILELLDENI